MKLFVILFKSASSLAFLAVALSMIDAILSIGLIELIQQILVTDDAASSMQIATFVLCCVSVLVVKILAQLVLTKVGEKSISQTLLSLCQRIANTPLRRLEEIGSHKALAAVTGDVGILATSLQGIPVLIGNAFTLVVGMIYLGTVSLPVMIGTICFIFFGYFSFKSILDLGAGYLKEARNHQDELTKHLNTLILGAKELKMHRDRMDSFLSDAIDACNQKVRSNQTVGYSIQGAAISWGRLMFFVTIGILLFSSNRWIELNSADRTACTLTLIFLMTPLERIIAWLPLLSRARISIAKIEAFGELESESLKEPSAQSFQSFRLLEIKDLCFRYEQMEVERTFSFGPIDFHLSSGEVVFLVGGNGSGKTTFLKLLTGLYEPHAGRIQLDEMDITEDNRESYRQLFSVVFAEPVLFDELHGLNWKDPQYVESLLVHLELDEKVKLQGGRLSTVDLSKGQRKRLALLTAYLEDRPIYVFDEWAADQDPVYKRVFYQEILPALQKRGKAVVVISHDDQYFNKADRIVRLADGRIASFEAALALETN